MWLSIGLLLLYKGVVCFRETSSTTATIWCGCALFVGFLKGRFIFTKTVGRITRRIHSLPSPISFRTVYPPAYWILIGSMMGLGMAMKHLPISLDIRGFVDVAVGSALMNGSLLYFRSLKPALSTQNQSKF
jgi:hypothetical protein